MFIVSRNRRNTHTVKKRGHNLNTESLYGEVFLRKGVNILQILVVSGLLGIVSWA